MYMDTDQPISIFMPELRGDDRAPIAALGSELLVAEHVLHQLHPEIGGIPVIDAGGGQRGREAVAGERRHDHIEGVFGVAAESSGIRKRTDYLVEIPESPGPSVSEDKRNRIRALAGFMDEMDRHPVDCG